MLAVAPYIFLLASLVNAVPMSSIMTSTTTTSAPTTTSTSIPANPTCPVNPPVAQYGNCNHDVAITWHDGLYIYHDQVEALFPANTVTTGTKRKTTYFTSGEFPAMMGTACIYSQFFIDAMRQAYAAGNQIASSGWTGNDINQMSWAQIDVEIGRMNDAFVRILGVRPKFYMPPTGQVSVAVAQYLRLQYGMTVVGWSDLSPDYNDVSFDYMSNWFEGLTSQGASPHLIYAHESSSRSVKALQNYPVLSDYEAKGLKFVTVAECLDADPYEIVTGRQADVPDDDWGCGYDWTPLNLDVAPCDTPTVTTTTSSTAAPTPSNVDGYNDWDYVGCFVDFVAARTLPNPIATTGGTAQLTVELCLDACFGAGYKYAGLEWSQECYCGNDLPPEEASDGTCSMVCNGNPLEYCGGGNGLSVYQNTNPSEPTTVQAYGDWTYSNCYVDSVANRVLPQAMEVPGGISAMTVELCLDTCQAAGYEYAGVEWSQECYCGRALPTTIAGDGRCDMKCNGNPLEYCGGGETINVYSYTGAATSGPTNVQTYKDFTYSGCYEDSTASRVLPFIMALPGGADTTTVETCIDACSAAGYAYAGVEWSEECYCGNFVPPTLATDNRCDMACKGDSLELCGGGDGISVYVSGAAATTLQNYAGWLYAGCYKDSVAARIMPVQVNTIDANSMTAEKCLDACNSLGYSYAGLEYSQECYCADTFTDVPVDDGKCDMVCKGNDREYCGGGDRMNVYQLLCTPPYVQRRS